GIYLPNRHFARLLRAAAGTHCFDNHEAAADADDLFADARATSGPRGVVHIKTGTNDRRVADAAGELKRQAGRRANAAEHSLLVESKNGHRVVARAPFFVFGGLCASGRSFLGTAFLPLGEAFGRIQVLQRESLLLREPAGAFAD